MGNRPEQKQSLRCITANGSVAPARRGSDESVIGLDCTGQVIGESGGGVTLDLVDADCVGQRERILQPHGRLLAVVAGDGKPVGTKQPDNGGAVGLLCCNLHNDRVVVLRVNNKVGDHAADAIGPPERSHRINDGKHWAQCSAPTRPRHPDF